MTVKPAHLLRDGEVLLLPCRRVRIDRWTWRPHERKLHVHGRTDSGAAVDVELDPGENVRVE